MTEIDENEWALPRSDITDLQLAFPAEGCKREFLPPWEELPESFKDLNGYGKTPEAFIPFQVANALFASGKIPDGITISIKEGVKADDMQKHIRVVLGCYGTKREHKIAGAAYLLWLWCEFKEG